MIYTRFKKKKKKKRFERPCIDLPYFSIKKKDLDSIYLNCF